MEISQEVIQQFKAYHKLYPAWGSLHIVLEDLNINTSHVEFCIEQAIKDKDRKGLKLAKMLKQMSKTQRTKVARKA